MSFKVIFKLLNSPSERAFTTNNIYLGALNSFWEVGGAGGWVKKPLE